MNPCCSCEDPTQGPGHRIACCRGRRAGSRSSRDAGEWVQVEQSHTGDWGQGATSRSPAPAGVSEPLSLSGPSPLSSRASTRLRRQGRLSYDGPSPPGATRMSPVSLSRQKTVQASMLGDSTPSAFPGEASFMSPSCFRLPGEELVRQFRARRDVRERRAPLPGTPDADAEREPRRCRTTRVPSLPGATSASTGSRTRRGPGIARRTASRVGWPSG